MKEQLFQNAYNKLNPAQKTAVDTIEGPVMVIAGPGTGKTQILTLRIANILLKTDAPADAILALTFTEAAAANMRRRLVDFIGTRGYYVEIATFHGFANRVIQDHIEYFPSMMGGRNASEVDQIGIMREILEEGEFEHLRPFGEPYFYAQDILSAIRDIKREGLHVEEFTRLSEKQQAAFAAQDDLYYTSGAHKGKMKGNYQKELKHIEKNRELSKIYAAYEAHLRAAKLYDFEDMILEVVRALETKSDFLLELQEKYQYILVDEHQDTNGAQNKLLEKLASFYEQPNLFVVGDEKQAIFRFQGASLENFLYFQKKYPTVKLISLVENYRSTQPILDSAESVIQENRAHLKAPLRGQVAEGEKIKIRVFESAAAEIFTLGREVKKSIESGVRPEEIAILYRENREANKLSDTLARQGVPYIVESDQNILEDPAIERLLLLLEAVHRFGDDEKLLEALHIDFLKIHPLDTYRLFSLHEYRDLSVSSVITNKERLEKIGVEFPSRLEELGQSFLRWKLAAKNLPFLEFLEKIMQESGFLSHALSQPAYFENIEHARALFDEVRNIVGERGNYYLADFMKHLKILREHGVMIRSKFTRKPKAVRLMTAHRAKGLEFDRVFIAGVIDGKWGNRRRREKFQLPLEHLVDPDEIEKNEDERRLFYMALTRARKEVVVSYATHGDGGKEQVPSQFISEIREDLKVIEFQEEADSELEKKPYLLFAPREALPPTLHDREFIKEIFFRRGLAATGLNNYLECPWKYFYSNLLRIPSLPTLSQSYGICVHRALQIFFEAKREGQEVGSDFLVSQFEESLRRQPLKERDKEKLLKKGRETLKKYFDYYRDSWNYHVLTEFAISGVHLREDVKLVGKLDKLELHDASGVVTVVDYKTKQPESRNWIEGKTANSSGSYKRQLVFYKLLLDLYPEKKFTMQEGVIDFVEPNNKGVFKREAFEISPEEVEELKQLILKVSDEILSLNFWNSRCEEKDCRYCKLRDLMDKKALA